VQVEAGTLEDFLACGIESDLFLFWVFGYDLLVDVHS
jgi:hypothetical protein